MTYTTLWISIPYEHHIKCEICKKHFKGQEVIHRASCTPFTGVYFAHDGWCGEILRALFYDHSDAA
jgi:hypothetical protein